MLPARLQQLPKRGKSASMATYASGHRTFGPKTLAFVKELGRRVRRETGEEKATSHLFQCLSVAIQRGNAAATRAPVFVSLTFNFI